MQETAKRTYEVLIAGLTLKLRSSHDEETVAELVALVDEKVNEAMGGHPNVSFQNALLLASLHIAEELILLKRVAAQELQGLESKAQEILTNLESSPLTQSGLDH
ncbi:MAG: cell division protein ZapA [Bdellovibrionales bacterium]|nr:cell division protein ZapA [Bdellovibrionales bacterium]